MTSACQGNDRERDGTDPGTPAPAPRLVVHPPDHRGWRRVRCDGQSLGIAYRLSDIAVFLTATGMQDAEDFDLMDPALVEWRGGGPEAWATPSQ
ncbi:hypothetical protein AB0B01_17160 [Streptomyces sp. NPDC044571]|uniref:hypothetical protein n=1 Tax=Streptomyces sp. NPDC044571 TaxID=3155371 RepID=UPI0033FD265D